MQGDPKIDELMRPVGAAIKRHVKDRDAVTEIYNRAYEAVMNSMDVNAAELAAANEDAARLAHSNTWVQVDDDGISAVCIHCGKHAKYERDVIHRPDCPIALHRARVGGAA